MSRKAIVLAAVAVWLAVGGYVSEASAQELSVGGGGFFASDFGGGFMSLKRKSVSANVDRESSVPWYGGGVNAFLDLTYAEIGLGLTFGGGTPQETRDGQTEKSKNTTISFTDLNIGALGKYPIPLSDQLTLFPAVGIDYALCLSGVSTYKREDGSKEESKLDGKDGAPKAGDFSALWIKFGGGMDYALSDKLFLRPVVLYGIRLNTKYENDAIDKNKIGAPPDAEVGSPLGHGLTVKVGVGFKL